MDNEYGAIEPEYEEVGPSDIEFGDYPSGFDEYGGDTEGDSIFDEEEDPDQRLRPRVTTKKLKN